ncbi:hypothetical protein ACFUIZ_14890 [Streptomyces cinereoruber]|uniref:hypothetical protein n=1 Tax=Streptomyces cinereoruber TaxID=67260 RepID=UPI00363AA156
MAKDPSTGGPMEHETDRIREGRCSARRTNGQPCGNWPMHGGTICRKHGGAATQVRNAAAARIAAAQDPAAAKLVELMQNPKVPYGIQLAAAKDLLDRGGNKSRDTILLETKKWEQVANGIVDEISFAADFPEEGE